MDYTHEAGRLLGRWVGGKKVEVVKDLLEPHRPITEVVLLTAALMIAMPPGDDEVLLELLDHEHKAFVSLMENASGLRS